MNKFLQNKAFKFVLAILAFVVIAYSYTPEVFEGKVVNQSDISSWKGMAQEIITHNDNNPDDRTLWTNSMFSGMPATTISVIYDGDYTDSIYKLLFLGERPASYLLISLMGGFILFLAFGVNFWLAFMGAIAISFCSYNMQIIQVGHNTKMVAIAFMPWVLAGVVYAYRKSILWGSTLFAFALSFQIKANHPQITYYLAMIIVGFGIWQLCKAIKEKTLPKFIKTSLIVLVAGLVGIATNINHLWPTYEYAEHTMRGGSELTQNSTGLSNTTTTEAGNKTRKGLDLDYATQWSYGIGESFNMLIPNMYGGASAGELDRSSNTYKTLVQGGYQGANQIIKQLPLYWGPQPFTAGPMYMGAISIFLFILGFFVLKGGARWWIGGVSLIALMLSWGYHFMPASELFFNWAPMYNKFRTVSMILVILQILIPVLAVLAANEVLFNSELTTPEGKKKVKNALCYALGLTAGVSALLMAIPSLAGDFISNSDGQLPDILIDSLMKDRAALLRADAFRSILFILLGAGAIWFAFIGKLKSKYAAIALVVLVLVDLWGVNKRYLNSSHFVTQREFSNAFNLREVDKAILEDKDPNYRVLDLSVNTFNDAYVSYHHKTIGGYSPAKLQRYQDLIEQNISAEIGAISKEFTGIKTLADAQNALTYHPVLSMLNTKYIVIDGSVPPIENPYRLGNAWFIENIITAKSADEEIAKLKLVDPAKEAVVSEIFAKNLKNSQVNSSANNSTNSTAVTSGTTAKDSLASIALTWYAPNKLVYSYSSKTPQTALFSEVYYSPGWYATLYPAGTVKGGITPPTLEGEALDIFPANWILRGLELPAGEYDIVFNFNPESFTKGEIYSKISSGILILLLIAALVTLVIRKKDKK